MSNIVNLRCDFCLYGEEHSDGQLYCYASPPKFLTWKEGVGIKSGWLRPPVNEDDWCRHWEPKGELA